MRHPILRLVVGRRRHRPARSGRVALIFVVMLGLGFTPSAQKFTGVGNRFPVNAEEFDRLFEQVKNWGRWGPDDELGSVNLITPAKRKQALTLAKTGQTVSLVHNPLTDKSEDNASPFEHTMNPGFNM